MRGPAWAQVHISTLQIHPTCIYRLNKLNAQVFDVVPPKRNIFIKTIVDIGSTQLRSSYETIMLELCIIFFPPVRSELVNAHFRGDSPRK